MSKKRKGILILMKKLIAVTLCLLLTVSLAACAGGGTPAGSTSQAASPASGEQTSQAPAASTGEKITLRLLNGQTGGFAESAIPVFESLNPNIVIDEEYVPSDGYFAKFSAFAASGQIPDILWSQAAFFSTQVESGVFVNLDEDLKGMNYEGDAVWIDTFIPELLDNSRSLLRSLGDKYTSTYYAVPYGMTSIAVVYDKNMFDAMGLSEPNNWAEFSALNDKLVADGKVPLSLTQGWLDWYPRLFWDQHCRSQLDANPIAFEEGVMKFTDEPVKKGLQDFKEMWDRGWLPESGLTASRETMTQIFIQGEIAQFLCTPSQLLYMYENAPENMSLASYPFPSIGNIAPRSLGGSSSVFGISEASANKEAALLFIKFLTSKTNFSQDYNMFFISGLNNVVSAPEADQLRRGYDRAAANGFSPEIFVPINSTPEMSNAWKSDLFPNYLMGVYDLDHVCNELQTTYDEYLKTIA